MTTPVSRAVSSALAAAATTALARRVLGTFPPGGAARWSRTNHRGGEVSLLEGPALVVGLAVGAGIVGGGPLGVVAGGAGLAAGAFGIVDDLAEDHEAEPAKGLRGHLAALRRGRLTTGGLKLLGIGATSLVAAAVLTPHGSAPSAGPAARAGRALDVLGSAALIASSANLVNLFDLRPGRALKAAAIGAGIAAVGACAGGGARPERTRAAAGLLGTALGAAAASAPRDLGERDMLGDGGANALGALLGAAVVVGAPRPVRIALLAATTALTLASEKVSFSAVIESTGVLRRIDAAGLRPGAPRRSDLEEAPAP